MTSWITLPQAPVTAGEAGHLNDHNNIQGGLSKLWSATMQSFYNVCHPTYGADPTGATDSTAAIQNAITAAAANPGGPGVVCIPAGTYKVTPSGSPAVALSLMGTGASGLAGVRIVGSGANSTTLLKGGNGTLLQLSGPSSSPSTGSTHCSYCTVESIGFNGGAHTGAIIQTYYAHNLMARDLYINNNGDTVWDMAECWDSQLYNVVFGGSGSATANSDTPNLYIRNSAASSGFGNSTGTTNDIRVHGCQFEAFTTGAVKIAQGPGNAGGPNVIFLTDCKMETSNLNGGNHLSVDTNSRGIYVKHLYAYSGGFQAGYSTAQDMISFSPQSGTLDDVLLSDGASATVANGITVNSPTAGETVVVENVTATWTTNPTGALINYGGTANGTLVVENYSATGGTLVAGTIPALCGGVTSTVTVTNTITLTNLESLAIPGGQPHVGSMYRLTGYGIYSSTGTPTINFQLYWGGTNIGQTGNIPVGTSVANMSWDVEALVTFRTATSCTAKIRATVGTSAIASATGINVPTAPVSVTTASSQNLTAAVQWGAAATGNTISLLGGGVEKVY